MQENTDQVASRSQVTIDNALQNIRKRRQTLLNVKGAGYDVDLAQQQLERVLALQAEIHRLIETAAPLNAEMFSAMLSKSTLVQSTLAKLIAQWSQDTEQVPERKVLKNRLRKVIFQLQNLLEDVQTELAELDGAGLVYEGDREVITETMRALEEEKQIVSVSDLGQGQKALILKQLQQLTLILFRLRHLALEPRLSSRLDQLEGIALQVCDTVETLDMAASNALELFDSSLSSIDRRLCRLEYDQRFRPLPVSWIVNQYRYVKRLRSVQARVLSGLGVSLTLSGFFFITTATMLSALSAYASSSEGGVRVGLVKSRENLEAQATVLLDKRKEWESTLNEYYEIEDKIAEEKDKIAEEKDEIAAEKNEQDEKSLESISKVTTQENSEKVRDQPPEMELLQETSTALIELEEDIYEEEEKIKESLDEIKNSKSKLLVKNEGKGLSKVLASQANFVNSKGMLNHSMRIILAGFSGLIGSVLSILIRLDTMDKENIKNPFLLGALKPLIGAIFGIAVFAILSTRVVEILPASFYLYDNQRGGSTTNAAEETGTEQLTGSRDRDPLGALDSQELYKIFLIAFIAGFSERLANDTLKSVSSDRSV